VNDMTNDCSVVVFWSCVDKKYVAQCREIPGCIGTDEDRGVAVEKAYCAIEENAKVAIELGLDSFGEKMR